MVGWLQPCSVKVSRAGDSVVMSGVVRVVNTGYVTVQTRVMKRTNVEGEKERKKTGCQGESSPFQDFFLNIVV